MNVKSTTEKRAPAGYSAVQIGLHWSIAALVLFQLAFGENMSEVLDEAEEAHREVNLSDALTQPHYWIGVLTLVLALIRLVLRVRKGVPRSPTAGPNWTQVLSRLTHAAFYVLLIAVPITGLLAVHVSGRLATVHSLAKPAFVLLILGHLAGGIYHQVVLKDGTMRRMFAPARQAAAAPGNF